MKRLFGSNRARVLALVAVTAVLAAVFALVSCTHRAAAPSNEAPAVSIALANVADTTLAREIVGAGTLGAKEEAPLAFAVPGVVASVDVEEGAPVRAGQRLATLEGGDVEGAIAKAQAASEKAERDYERAKALYADSVISKDRLELAETGARVARGDLRMAGYARAKAAIVAPSSGVVLHRLVEPGQTVGAGTPVFVFGASAKGEVVRFGVPDRDAVRIAPGDPATLTFDTHPGRTFAAHVAHVSAGASPGAGTYEVELKLDAPLPADFGPASGLVADVHLTPKRADRVRLVPMTALLEGDGDRGFVWVLDASGAPRRRDVRIAFFAGESVAIASGLEGVAKVVSDGAPYLSEGARVRVHGR